MSRVIEYECPCCGGAVEFDSTIQKMKCPYCDTEFDVSAFASYTEELNNPKEDDMTWESEAGNEWQEGETDNMCVYICQSCGGEIIGDANLGSMMCPYCNNNIVVKEKFEGSLKPDFVIPFKLDKKAAKEGLKKHLQGKRLLPKPFKDENHLDEIKGIYVPFWLFDAQAEGEMKFRGTRVRVWSDSNYNYTDTSFYSVVRGGTVEFEKVPVDGSTRMPDDLMESLEPYDFSEAVDFNTAYLAGYLADKYDVDVKQSVERANERIKKSTEDFLSTSVSGGYQTLTPQGSNIALKNSSAKYALYPVWILNTTWKGQKFLFAMNGQTGKFVGDLPMDTGAFWKWYGLFAVIMTVIVHIIRSLIF